MNAAGNLFPGGASPIQKQCDQCDQCDQSNAPDVMEHTEVVGQLSVREDDEPKINTTA
jgi:hypothetical protein